MDQGSSTSDNKAENDIKNILSGYMASKREGESNEMRHFFSFTKDDYFFFSFIITEASTMYDSEISEPEDSDQYDDTFVVDDDVAIDQEEGDEFDEESLLSDPSDLFEDDGTESEPSSEPEIVYRQKKMPHNTFIDYEADEDNELEEDDDEDFEHLYGGGKNDEIVDDDDNEYEGPCDMEIKGPLNINEYEDEEAIEHNDLNEMYGELVGREDLSSHVDEFTSHTIGLSSDTEEEEDVVDLDSSSSPNASSTEGAVVTKKSKPPARRRRLMVLESEDEDENELNDTDILNQSTLHNDLIASQSSDVLSKEPKRTRKGRQLFDLPPEDSPLIIQKKRRRLMVVESDNEMSARKVVNKLSENPSSFIDITSSPLTISQQTNDSPLFKKKSRKACKKIILESDDDDDEKEPFNNKSVMIVDEIFESSLREPKLEGW